MTVRSTSRAPQLRIIADAPRARAATGGIVAATAFAVASATMVLVSPQAFAADPASAAAAASAPGGESATRFAVKPGQSLNDVAIAVTQSHDRAVLSRASKAIFDANPASFMRGDPSLMKLGAVLTIPPLDSTGAVVAQAPAPSAAPGASGAAAAGASVPHGAAPASSSAAASAAGASAPLHGEPPQGTAVGGAAASANVASTPGLPASPVATPRAAVQSPNGAPASAPPATAATAASGVHAWAGAIQQAPTTPAASATSPAGTSESAAPAPAPASAAASTGTTAAASASTPATAARPRTFSSLQQLLAFKNRVLMDLQRHGFGLKASREAGGSAVGASGASVVVPAQVHRQAGSSAVPAPRAPQSDERFIGIGGYGVSVTRASVPTIAAVASAVVAALLVLIVALAISGRKRRAARATAAPVRLPETAAAADAAGEREFAPAHAEGPRDPVEAEYLSTLARTPTSKRALMGLAGHYAERGNARGFDEIAQRIRHLSGGQGPNWLHIAALGRQLDPDNPLYASSAEEAEDTLDESVGGEDVLPPHSAQAQSAAEEPDVEVKLSGAEHSEASAASPIAATPEAEPATHAAEQEAVERHGEDDAPARSAVAEEPEAAPSTPEAVDPRDGVAPSVREPRFPAEAIAALNDLDLGLPPRVETAPTHEQEPTPHAQRAADADVGEGIEPGLATEPAHEPEPTRAPEVTDGSEPTHELEVPHGQAPTHESAIDHEPETTHEPESTPTPGPTHEPAAPTAMPAAVAGLGAARFGPLKLAFDLDLPADDSNGAAASTPPQPAFTPEEIAKIARNKLELAAEYIELGDLGGARTLIHEVIESNDPATRHEAQALLATLAPHS